MAIRLYAKFALVFLSYSSLWAEPLADTVSSKIKATISCPTSIKQAQDRGDFKDAIRELNALIAKKQEAALYLQLAVCYLQDQQEEEALKTFITCLEKSYSKQNKVMSVREEASFKELLGLYLANSKELDQKLEAIVKAHPDYTHVQFILASQAANAKRYEPFFYLFYQSYCSYPDSHMSHKTQGVIASLLMQRVKSPEEKDLWRKKAISSFMNASKLCPEDTGLYRMIIYTSSESDRKPLVQFVINEIIEKNSKIPRSEIPFFINAALMVDEIELATSLLDKAKTWYEYSRIIQDMQDEIANRKAQR